MKESDDFKYWLITEDTQPEPWDTNQWPYKVIFGNEEFAKSICDRKNKENPDYLYEFQGISVQTIEIQHLSDEKTRIEGTN